MNQQGGVLVQEVLVIFLEAISLKNSIEKIKLTSYVELISLSWKDINLCLMIHWSLFGLLLIIAIGAVMLPLF